MKNYTYHKKVIIRTPFKPLKTKFSKEELLELFSKTEIQEAIFLSSPNLLDEFIKWENGYIKDPIEEEKLIYSLNKYALRMHSRCTPFGLFAGCNLIDFGDVNDILLESNQNNRSTRLDMNFTCALSQTLSKLPFIQPHLKYYPNSSIYNLQDKIRYVEYNYKSKRRIHQISSVDSSIYLSTILDNAKNGATLNELAQCIVGDGVTLNDALEFVKNIYDAQILVSELEPSVTGDELFIQIIKTLNKIKKNQSSNELSNIIGFLENVKKQLIQIDTKIGNDVSIYKKLAEQLKQLNVPFDINRLYQTDMYISPKKGQAYITVEIQKQLNKAISILNRLTIKPSKTNLTEFRKKFHERYGDKEVALLDALDIETGVGYAQNNNHSGGVNPLVNDLILPLNNSEEAELRWNKKESFLFRKLLKSQREKQYEINIELDELKDFEENWEDLPDSFSLVFQYYGKKDDKDLLGIVNVGGSSATCLLGRFGTNHEEIRNLIKEIADTEQENNPKEIFAEIVHLPESRTGNILMRPAFRGFEIPYLSKSAVAKECQIALEDLYISINNNELYLRSKRLDRRIIPRLGNAHSYSTNALPVYHLLGDLQMQNKRVGIYFEWGSLNLEFAFLPRVTIDNVVISRATWQLIEENFQSLLIKNVDLSEEIINWKKNLKMPDLVLLVEGDNELLINLRDKLSVDMFISIIRKRTNIVLKEFLFDIKTALVKDEKGEVYTNELIAILQREKDKIINDSSKNEENNQEISNKKKTFQLDKENKTIVRTFSLGSEWLYYKLYCGIKTSDKILTEVIQPLVENLMNLKMIDYWFFIRYADPEKHLRIRFHLSDMSNIGIVIQSIQDAIEDYEKNGLIWKIQTDTYQRELERYGENSIVFSEELFCYDSNCIVSMLDMIDGDEGEEIRWMFGIKSVNELLNIFNYSHLQKLGLMEQLKTGFANEFRMNKDLKMQLDKKFRFHRKTISALLDNESDETSSLKPLFDLLELRSNEIKPLAKQILTLNDNNQLQISINSLLASYIHMTLNRLFKNQQRLHEMVVYDFMWRTYRSELAKQKQLKKQLVS